MSIRTALMALAEEHGGLTPELVLETARDPEHELHTHFTWDETEAAERWRLHQARTLIMRVKITVEAAPDRTVRVRAFTNVRPDDGAGTYVPTDRALADPAMHDVVIRQAMRDLAALRAKYQALTDFDEVLRSALDEHEAA